MKTLITLLGAALLVSSMGGCVTESSDNGPQATVPQGSGGRGASPGYHAETSAAKSRTER